MPPPLSHLALLPPALVLFCSTISAICCLYYPHIAFPLRFAYTPPRCATHKTTCYLTIFPTPPPLAIVRISLHDALAKRACIHLPPPSHLRTHTEPQRISPGSHSYAAFRLPPVPYAVYAGACQFLHAATTHASLRGPHRMGGHCAHRGWRRHARAELRCAWTRAAAVPLLPPVPSHSSLPCSGAGIL